MAWDPRTRDYVTKRRAEGKSTKEIIRCLKRHIARELYRLLVPLQPHPPVLRTPLDSHRSFGKIERLHRTLAAGRPFQRLFTSESARRSALPAWIHEYNHHRPHTAIGKVPPITRLTNVSGQYN